MMNEKITKSIILFAYKVSEHTQQNLKRPESMDYIRHQHRVEATFTGPICKLKLTDESQLNLPEVFIHLKRVIIHNVY